VKTSLSRLLPVFVTLGLIPVLILTSWPAQAAARRKPHRDVRQHRVAPPSPSRDRDDRLFMRGRSNSAASILYLGDDPDPFIRQMLLRDPGAVFGGDN